LPNDPNRQTPIAIPTTGRAILAVALSSGAAGKEQERSQCDVTVVSRADPPEKPTVNRPFYAFGLLLFLLAAAMLAVSSTSRSTTVRPRAAASKADLPARRPQPAGIYVVVLPADNVAETDEDTARFGEIAISETAVTSSQGEVHSTPTCLLNGESVLQRRRSGRLIGVRIEPASDGVPGHAVEDQCSPLGQGDSRMFAEQPAQVGFRQSGDVNTEDLVDLFHSFIPRRSALERKQSAWRVGNLRTMLLGLSNWLTQKIRQTGWNRRWPIFSVSQTTTASKPAIDWRDYADLMDQMIGTRAVDLQPPNAAATVFSVRSGHWLFDFAALSLGRMEIVLQAATQQIQRLGNELVVRDSGAVSQ
jgi:hypothetical protein